MTELAEVPCRSFTLPVGVRSPLCSVCGWHRDEHPQLPDALAPYAELAEEQFDPDFRPARRR